MTTKHVTNETGMVLDALKGLVAKNGNLALNAQYKGTRAAAGELLRLPRLTSLHLWRTASHLTQAGSARPGDDPLGRRCRPRVSSGCS